MTIRQIKQRGDTIIEVVLAVAIFSFVAIGSMAIMSRGVAMAQSSLELTLVRQQIDSQAEMLRFIVNESRSKSDDGYYATLWGDLKGQSTGESAASIIGTNQCLESSAMPGHFALRSSESGNIVKVNNYEADPATYARVFEDLAEGLSIQLVPVANDNAYDAYIQACWDSPGSDLPSTIGTIVRMYVD